MWHNYLYKTGKKRQSRVSNKSSFDGRERQALKIKSWKQLKGIGESQQLDTEEFGGEKVARATGIFKKKTFLNLAASRWITNYPRRRQR